MSRLSLHAVTVAVSTDSGPLFSPITFDLEQGKVLVVSGPSGSGKSTLLRAIARLIPLFRGTIKLDGEETTGAEVPSYRRRVAYTPQVPSAHDESVERVLQRPFTYRAAGERAFSRDTAVAYLEKFGFSSEILGQSFHDLSVGEKQRVCLIRTFLLEPLFLLLDEPTSALDAENAQALYRMLQSLPQKPGCILVSHDEAWKDNFDNPQVWQLSKS